MQTDQRGFKYDVINMFWAFMVTISQPHSICYATSNKTCYILSMLMQHCIILDIFIFSKQAVLAGRYVPRTLFEGRKVAGSATFNTGKLL